MFDINTVKEQVKKVIAYSQGIDDPKVDELLNNWLSAKKNFIEAFGGNLIWESPTPMSFSLGESQKKSRVEDFADTVYTTYLNPDLSNFIDANSDSFFENRVAKAYSYNEKTIPAGMKLVKAFKYFEDNQNTLDILQSKASQIIQEDKVHGTLCFSVHPLDFLSSSENTYNWRSCHSLDGDYRAGNLAYMQDSCTVICYIKGDEDTCFSGFGPVAWNDKKWRVLLFMSIDWNFLAVGRQYPFAIKDMDSITDLFLQALSINRFSFSTLSDFKIKEVEGRYLVSPVLWMNGHLVHTSDIIKDQDCLHFNDLLRSRCYEMSYRVSRSWSGNPQFIPKVKIGHPVKCLQCGKTEIQSLGTMRCDNCELEFGDEANELVGYCEHCGARYLRDQGYEEMSTGDQICPACVDTECFVCEECGELYYNTEEVYDEDQDRYICRDCAENLYEHDCY